MPELTVPVAGGALSAWRFGSAEPVVLAVHGITSTSHTWLAVARALDGSCSLLACDLRGRGHSNSLPDPYGVAAHVRDLLALLDEVRATRVVAVGHSLGAYIIARLAADHPKRVSAVVLVDGGLTIPGAVNVDPQAFAEAFLGPALARLGLRFQSREAYREWWRAHPALAGASDVAADDLNAYADYDLEGDRSSVAERAVRADAEELLELGEPAHRIPVLATLLCAPRGLLDDPNPMQPLELVESWVAEAPSRRQAIQVPGTNHYTIVLGTGGATAVADAIRARL